MGVQGEGSSTENLPVMWPAAALDLGYHTRRLWSLLQSVWEVDSEGLESAEDSLVGVHHALLALDGRLNPPEFAHTRTLLHTVDELQTETFEFVNGLKAEIFRTWNVKISEINYNGLQERTERLLPGMIEERRGLWDMKMDSAWGELRLLSHRAVAADDLLTAWWEVGFRLADVTTPKNHPGSPLAADDQDVTSLNAAIERLPVAHQHGVNAILPTVPKDDPRYAVLLHEAYIACRNTLMRAGRVSVPTPQQTEEFEPSDNYRLVKVGSRRYTFTLLQSKMVRALYAALNAGKLGLSAEKLFSEAENDRDDKRVEHVFRKHPALVDGLVEKIEGGVWRLNLNTQNTHQKPAS